MDVRIMEKWYGLYLPDVCIRGMRCHYDIIVVASLAFVYFQPVPLADIEHMSLVTVTREDELSRCVRIYLPTSDERVMKMTVPILCSFSLPVVMEVCS